MIFQSRRRFACGLRLSPIVNPFILNTLFVYSIRLQVVIPWSPQAVLKTGPRGSSFSACLPKVYVLSVSPIQSDYITWCICITSSTRVTSPRNFDLFT